MSSIISSESRLIWGSSSWPLPILGHGVAPLGRAPVSKVGAVAEFCWSSHDEIPHVQGKRNPGKMVGVARRHQRADTLKPYSQKTSQSGHTRIMALSKSMKPRKGRSWWRGLTECGPLEKRMANHFSILALRTP